MARIPSKQGILSPMLPVLQGSNFIVFVCTENAVSIRDFGPEEW